MILPPYPCRIRFLVANALRNLTKTWAQHSQAIRSMRLSPQHTSTTPSQRLLLSTRQPPGVQLLQWLPGAILPAQYGDGNG